MLTAWCEAQISCDGDPCKAPLTERAGLEADVEPAVATTKEKAIADVKRDALRTGWTEKDGQWFCPWCSEKGG